MKILKFEREKPRWVVDSGLETVLPQAGNASSKIARLPPAVRHELNQRLQNREKSASLARWLNSLPETKAAIPERSRHPKITSSDLVQWKKGGFRAWQKKAAWEAEVVRLCREWSNRPEIREKLFGPRLTWLQVKNGMRAILGLEPFTREDFPDDQDWTLWNSIPTQKERQIAHERMWGIGQYANHPNRVHYLGSYGPPLPDDEEWETSEEPTEP